MFRTTRKPADPEPGDRENGFRKHLPLAVIVVAALLLELTTGLMYCAARDLLRGAVERLVQRDMNAIAMSIREQLAKVEVAVDNMDWILRDHLPDADSMFGLSRQLVENNPAILGSSISFVPGYYPRKGRWFEPYAVRRGDGTVASMQLGSAGHDYLQREFFAYTVAHDSPHWSEPYLDPDGARQLVTTYSAAVHDGEGRVVAVVDADLSLEWLEALMEESKGHRSFRRFLLSRDGSLLAGEDGPAFRDVRKLVEADADRQGYEAVTGADGGKRHVFYNPVGGRTGWTLVCVCGDREIFAKLRRRCRSLLLLGLAGLLPMAFIVVRASRNLKNLREANAEKERIAAELDVASRIQRSMLPGGPLARDGAEACGLLEPAREVGGDLFDYCMRDGELFFCIGDVSGKGVPSALLMAKVQALFRSASARESDPARIVRSVNRTLCQGNGSNMFATLFAGVLDPSAGRLRYCNAGHEVPIVLGGGARSVDDCKPHLPAGVFEDVEYETQELRLQPDEILFLHTDGLTEAKNGQREQFGAERTGKVLGRCAAGRLPPRQVLEAVAGEVHRFVGGAERSDDLTMLAIRCTPGNGGSMPAETLVLDNDMGEVARFGAFAKSALAKTGLAKPPARQLRLAAEEAVVNAIAHAYPAGSGGKIGIRIASDGRRVTVAIADSGVPFDPTAQETPDTDLPAEDRRMGGLGILLMRGLTDGIRYERTGGKNVLTLTKNIT